MTAEPADREETLEEWARRKVAEATPPDRAKLERIAVILAPDGGDDA